MKDYAKALSNLVEQVEKNTNYENVYVDRDTLQELVDLHTPPTEEEVCKALSEQLKKQIKISKNKHGITFNYAETGKTIISLNYNLIHINVQLPPHLITMIGRFYEGLDNE